MADNRDGRRIVRRQGILDGRENRLRSAASFFICQLRFGTQTKPFPRPTASLECIPGVFPSETVVDFDGRRNSGEERGVEWLEDEIGVSQVGETGRTFVNDECLRRRKGFGIRRGAYILVGSVPSCATMTVFNDGENPTYPV